jgi:hypothetical protein
MEPDCTAKHCGRADCSDDEMAAQWRKWRVRELFQKVLPACNVRRQTCEWPPDRKFRRTLTMSTYDLAAMPPTRRAASYQKPRGIG